MAARVGVERCAQRGGGPVEPRLGSAQGHAHCSRGVRERKAQVVVEHDDGSLLRLEPAHAALDLFPVGGRRLSVHHRDWKELGKLDLEASPLGKALLVPTGIQEEPVEPSVEAINVAKSGQVPPAPDERLLDGVLCSIGISKDETGRGIQPADRGACQHGEGVMIAFPGSLHEFPLHASPSASARSM
jgi:hypothetical protein